MGDCNIHNIFHMKPLRVCINDTLIKKKREEIKHGAIVVCPKYSVPQYISI